jgi:hypothetical protein
MRWLRTFFACGPLISERIAETGGRASGFDYLRFILATSIICVHSIDTERGELYVPVGNPAPDYAARLRHGANLYTDSLLALDMHSGKLNWYIQFVPNDSRDWDLTQVSPIVDAMIGSISALSAAEAVSSLADPRGRQPYSSSRCQRDVLPGGCRSLRRSAPLLVNQVSQRH